MADYPSDEKIAALAEEIVDLTREEILLVRDYVSILKERHTPKPAEHPPMEE
ncbi:MAG: hypothetical protein LBB67_03595 [Oscillospiraceae bacterium]|jgi:hypothetical protein|nr:hypothetical protein [Oscillospiraceae bacterium]